MTEWVSWLVLVLCIHPYSTSVGQACYFMFLWSLICSGLWIQWSYGICACDSQHSAWVTESYQSIEPCWAAELKSHCAGAQCTKASPRFERPGNCQRGFHVSSLLLLFKLLKVIGDWSHNTCCRAVMYWFSVLSGQLRETRNWNELIGAQEFLSSVTWVLQMATELGSWSCGGTSCQKIGLLFCYSCWTL